MVPAEDLKVHIVTTQRFDTAYYHLAVNKTPTGSRKNKFIPSQWNFTVNVQWSFIRRAPSTKHKSWAKKAFQSFEKSILIHVLDKDSFCSLQLLHIVYISRKKHFICVRQIGLFLLHTLVSQIHSVGITICVIHHTTTFFVRVFVAHANSCILLNFQHAWAAWVCMNFWSNKILCMSVHEMHE